MQERFLSRVSAFVLALFCACGKPPCRCDFDDVHSLECKLVDAQGQNLVFGTAPKYRFDSIRVLNAPNEAYVNNAAVRKGSSDTTALRFDFYVAAAKSYLYFNRQATTDSLEIAWETKTGRCCESEQAYHTAGTVRFNGSVVQPQNGLYVLVKR